jgi:hypothetical protein
VQLREQQVQMQVAQPQILEVVVAVLEFLKMIQAEQVAQVALEL